MPNQPNQPVDVVKAILSDIPANQFDMIAKSGNMNVQLFDAKTSYENNKDVLGDMDFPTFEKFYNDRVIPYDKARKNSTWMQEDIARFHSRPTGGYFGSLYDHGVQFAPIVPEKSQDIEGVKTSFTEKPLIDPSDIQAERVGYYDAKDGTQKPIADYKITDGTVLVPKQDEETGQWRYKETPLGDVAQGFNMRTAFGPKTLTKSWDLARAIGNSFSSILSAIGHVGEVGTRLATFGNVDDQTKAIRWSRALQNLGEYGTSRAQEDDNSGITLYNTADGLAQLFQQVAIAYATGGVATMAELGIAGTAEAMAKSGGKKAMGGFQKAAFDIIESNLGREGADAAIKRISKAGMIAGLGFGSLQAAGAWKVQARTLGINEQDAALMYLGIGSITAAIEAKIGPNQFISFWEREGGKKVGAKALADSLFEYKEKAGFASIKEMMANDKAGAMKFALSQFNKTMSEASEKLMEYRAGRAALGFWEEGAEEFVENVQDKTFQAGYDFVAPFIYDKMGRDKTNLKTGDGLFGTNIEDIMKGNEQDFLVGGVAGLIGGGMMSGNHAKNVAYHSITQGFAAKGKDAGNEYRQEIADAVRDVKEGRSSWIENVFTMKTGEKFTFGTDNLARAKYNAEQLNGLVDMAESIYFNSGLDELNKKVGALQDSKQRQQLSYLLETEIIPQALKQESYIPIREQKIEELKQSKEPGAEQEIAKLEQEIKEWAGRDKVLYDPVTKTSPKFNMYYNDILAVNDENNPSANKYSKMTPNGTGLGVFSNHLMFAEAAHGINLERQKANEELKQQQKAGDDAANDFADKAKQYDVLANPSHHEEAFKEIQALFAHPMTDETKQKVVTAIDSIATNFRSTLEEGEEDPYSKLTEALNARQERKEQPMLTPFDLYSTVQLVDDGTGKQTIQSYAHDIDHKIEALRTDTNASEAEINNLEAQLDNHEAIAETSNAVWSKYDSSQQQNLVSPIIKEVQHQPVTAEQLEAIRKKNVERKQKIQEIRGEIAKNRKGLIIEMARNQNNDLKRRQHMLRSIFTVLKLKDQLDLVEQVKLLDNTSVNDKSLEALNAEDKKIQNLEQYLWDNDKIKSVRKNITKIMNDISDPAAYRDFEYFDIKMDKASDYALFAGGKGGTLDQSRIARLYALNYFHFLLHVSPKEFNSVYLKSLENDESGIITSYEQEQVEKTAYAHTQNPDTSWMLDTVNGGVDLFKEPTKLGGTPILTNAFLIRGLGRSGKSTEATARTVKMASIKAGKQLNVLVIGPNEQLAKIHQDNVGKSAVLKFMFTDEVDSAHNLNQYDMVIVDETSILTDNQIYNELDRGSESFTKMLGGLEKGKPVLLLGDDTQIVGRDSEGKAMTYVPVSHYCLRSPSMAFRFATGNQDIWNLENAILNSIAMQGKISPAISYPNTFFTADHTSGVMQTVSKKEVVDAFIADFKANPTKESEFILLTTNEEEAQQMRDMLQAQGIDGKFVKPVEYSVKRTSAQGGRWPRVYIAIEENRTDSNNVRVLNTAVGRSSGFICIVGTGKSEEGNTIDILKADPEKTAMLQKALADNQAIRLKMLSEVSGKMEDIASKAKPTEQTLLNKLKELNSKVKYPNDTHPKYVIDGTDYDRVHTVMKKKSNENYDSRPIGTPYALGLGNLGDQIAKDAMTLSTKENIITQIKKLVATPVEFQNGDKTQLLQVNMTNDDVERLANDFIKLFNGELIPGLNRDLVIPQVVVHGEVDGQKTAGAMDFAWVKNNKVSKLDVKTYRPKKDGTPAARSIESWNEQMGIYEDLLVKLGIPSNNETFIIGIPLDYETPKDGRTSISVKYAESGLHVTALGEMSKAKQPAPKQSTKGTPSTKTRTTTEQQANPETEDFADFSTEEAENFGNKYKENLINNGIRQMVGMTMFPLLHADTTLGKDRGSKFNNRENSIHTAIINTAIRQINSLIDSGVPVKLKVVYNEDSAKQFVSSSTAAVNKALSVAEKYLGPLNGKLPSITLAIDPTLNNYHGDIAEAMVNEYRRLTKDGTDYNHIVKKLQDAGYFNLSMLYSFRDNAPAEAKQMYLDLAAMHKVLKGSKESFYVPVTAKIPGAVFKKYGGEVISLADLIQDVNSREQSGAQKIIISKEGFRYMANVTLTGDPNTAIKIELGGKYAITDGQLIKQLQDAINSIVNDDRTTGSTTNDVVSFESAKSNAMWQTMRQNATWLVNVERSGSDITGITAKKGQPDFTRFFGLSKGKDGKVYVMPKVNGKVVGMNASSKVWYKPTAAEYKAYFKEFLDELKTKIDNDPEFAKKFRTNFGIMKDGSAKGEEAIDPKDYGDIVVEGKHLSMPKITVDMNPVFKNESGIAINVVNNVNNNNDSSDPEYNSDFVYMARYEKKKKSDGLIDVNVEGVVSLPQNNFSIDEITPEQLHAIMNDDGTFTISEKKKTWSRLTAMFGNDEFARNNWVSGIIKTIRKSNVHGMDVRKVDIENGEFKAPNYKIKDSIERARILLRGQSGLQQDIETIFDLIKQGKPEEIHNASLLRHEAIFGQLDFEKLTFDRNGLISKINKNGFNSLNDNEKMQFMLYLSGSDIYFNAAINSVWPGYTPDYDTLESILQQKDEDSTKDEATEYSLKRNYGAEYGASDSTSTYTAQLEVLFRSLSIVRQRQKGKIVQNYHEAISTEKLKHVLLKVAIDRHTTIVPAGMANTDANRFWTALVNARNANPNSHDGEVLTVFLSTVGAPYELLYGNKTAFKQRLRSTLRNGNDVTYYDMYYNTNDVAEAMLQNANLNDDPNFTPSDKLQNQINALAFKKETARQMITQLLGYYRSVNIDRLATALLKENNQFRLKPLDSMNEADIQRNMILGLTSHVQIGSAGLYIPQNTRRNIAKYSIVEKDGRISISIGSNEMISINRTAAGLAFEFSQGKGKKSVADLSKLLKLNLNSGFFDTYVNRAGNNEAKLAKVLGSMTVSLMDMSKTFEIQQLEQNIKELKNPKEGAYGIKNTIGMQGKQLDAALAFNNEVNEKIQELQTKIDEAKDSAKLTAELVSIFEKEGNLQPAPIDVSNFEFDETFAEGEEEIDEALIEEQKSAVVKGPMNFPGYIRELAVVNSSTFDVKSLSKAYNAAGKRQYTLNWGNRINTLIPGTNIASLNGKFATTFNSPHWMGYSNNVIGLGVLRVSNPRLLVGAKNDFQGVKQSSLTEKDRFRIAADAFINTVNNMNKFQLADIVAVILGESSYSTVNTTDFSGKILEVKNSTREVTVEVDGKKKKEKKPVKLHAITNKYWDFAYSSFETLANKAEERRIASEGMFKNSGNADLEKLSSFRGKEWNVVERFINLQQTMLLPGNVEGQQQHNKLMADAQLHLRLNQDYRIEKVDGVNMLLPGSDFLKSSAHVAFKLHMLERELFKETDPSKERRLKTQIKQLRASLPFYNDYGTEILKNEQNRQNKAQTLRELLKHELNDYFQYTKETLWTPNKFVQWNILDKEGNPAFSKTVSNTYIDEKGKEQTVYGKEYNPAYEAFFYHSIITNMSLGDQQFGSFGAYKDILEFYKRIKSAGGPGIVPITSDEINENIPSRLNAIVTRDVKGFQSKENRSNGAIYLHPMADIALINSYGGIDANGGILKQGIKKPLLMDVDINGTPVQLKCAFVPNDHHMMASSKEKMQEFRRTTGPTLLEAFDRTVNEIEFESPELPRHKVYEQALLSLNQMVKENPSLHSEIIHMIVPIDGIKLGVTGLVNFWQDGEPDPTYHNYIALGENPNLDIAAVQKINIRELRIQQEATRTVGESNVSYPTQWLEWLSTVATENKNAQAIDTIRAQMTDSYLTIMNNMLGDTEKAMGFMRSLGLDGQELSAAQTITDALLRNQKVNLDLEPLVHKLTEKLFNHINKFGIKAMQSGQIMKQVPGYHVKRYTYNGYPISYRGAVRLLKKGVIDNKTFKDLVANATAQNLEEPRNENGKLIKGHMAAPFYYRKEYGIPEGADQSEIFGVILNNKYTDLRYLSANEIYHLIPAETDKTEGNWILEKFSGIENPEVRANEIFNFLQLMKKLNTHFVVRTPSVASSAGWYENVEWSTWDNNTAMFPDAKADRDGTDYDYDDVSVLAYALNENLEVASEINYNPITVKQHNKNLGAYQNRIMDILEKVYDNPKSFEEFTEPTSTKAYLNLVDDKPLANQTLPYNPSVNNKVADEFTKSRNLVGATANIAKAYNLFFGAMMNIQRNGDHWNSQMIPTNTASGDLNFGKTTASVLGNRINVVIDNGKIIAMNAINLNSITGPIQAAMIWEGLPSAYTAEEKTQLGEDRPASVIEFFDKPYIRNFIKRIESSKSITYFGSLNLITELKEKISDMQARVNKAEKSPMIRRAKDMVEQGYHEELLDRYEKQLAILETERELVKNGQSLASIRGIVFDDPEERVEEKKKLLSNEEIRKQRKQKQSAIDKDLAHIQEEIDLLNNEIYKAQIITRLADFNTLLSYARRGEAIRRFAKIVSLNQGTEVNNAELYADKREIEFILGSSLSAFNQKINDSYDYMSYYSGLSADDYEKVKEEEEFIRGNADNLPLIDIRQIVDARPQLAQQLKAMELGFKFKDVVFDTNEPIFNDIHDKIMPLIGASGYKFSGQYYTLRTEVSKFERDMFYEHEYNHKTAESNKKFEFIAGINDFLGAIRNLPGQNEDYYFNYNNDYTIAGEGRGRVFLGQMIGLCEFIQNNLGENSDRVNMEMAKRNPLIQRMRVMTSNSGSKYIQLIGADSTSDGTVGLLRDGFKNLYNPHAENENERNVSIIIDGVNYNIGEWLQQGLRHYQFMANAFTVKRSSFPNIIDDALMVEFSKFADKFSKHIEEDTPIQMLHGFKSPSEIFRLASLQIPVADSNLVPITMKKADKMEYAKRPYFVRKMGAFKKYEVYRQEQNDDAKNDEKLAYYPIKLKAGPVGIRYSTAEENGLPANISYGNKISIYGSDYASFIRLMNGYDNVDLFFDRKVTYLKANTVINVDGLPVIVNEVRNSSITVSPLTNGYTASDMAQTIAMAERIQEAREKNNSDKETEKKINNCKK